MVPGDVIAEKAIFLPCASTNIVQHERYAFIRLSVADNHYVRCVASYETCHNVPWQIAFRVLVHLKGPTHASEEAFQVKHAPVVDVRIGPEHLPPRQGRIH